MVFIRSLFAIAITIILMLWLPGNLQAQFVNNGASFIITNNATVYTNASFRNTSGGTLVNNGSLITDSTLINDKGASISGNGYYGIQFNLTNNGNFQPDSSTVEFTGNTNSHIRSVSGALFNLSIKKGKNFFVLIDDPEMITSSVSFAHNNNYIKLNGNTVTLGAQCTINNYNDQRYFITNDTGSLKKVHITKTAFTFPVGATITTYNPLTITGNETGNAYSVRCLADALVNGAAGTVISKNGISASWFVNQLNDNGSKATLEASWKSSDELTGFNENSCQVVRYNGSKWDFNANNSKAATGNTYKKVSRDGLSSFGYFTVLSSAQLSLQDELANNVFKPGTQTGLKIYPTIVKDRFTIGMEVHNKGNDKMDVVLLDMNGRQVWQQQLIICGSQQVKLPGFAGGMYTVVVHYDDISYTQKIIISR